MFPPFDSSTFASQLLWLAITFVALYFLLARFAIPQIGGILTDRASRIAGDIEKGAEGQGHFRGRRRRLREGAGRSPRQRQHDRGRCP